MRTCITAIYMLLCVSTVQASDLMKDLFGCTSNERCVIRKSEGGSIRSFGIAAEEARVLHTRIVIDGRCESACVIFASSLRDQVCLTARARMRIHLGTKTRVYDSAGKELDEMVSLALASDLPAGYTVRWSSFVPDYGDDINAWAIRNHKIHPDPAVLTTIPYQVAMRFWKPCR